MIGLAALLIVTFRLRDDLADRERDAIEHPERVLTRAASTRPFALAVAFGLALAFVHVHRTFGLTRGLALLGLAAAFELAYRLELPGRHRWVLLKYPIFALLLADRLAPTLAGLCYASFAIYERIDDPALRQRPDADLRLAAYLFAAALLGGFHLYSSNASFGWLLTFGGLWAFAVEAARGRGPGARFGLFLVCLFLWLHDQFAPRGAWP
jgi:4-hydroxybenzoate polyprenyltransferase